MPFSRTFVVALAVAVLWPLAAGAQIGVGMRIATVNGDEETGTEDIRYTGAHLRGRMSPRTGFELSLDWRSEENDTETLRTVERPFQGSVLLYLLKTQFAPYVLGGVGWYYRRAEVLGPDEEVLSETSSRPFGYHAGFGAEIRLGRRAGVHADYRYTNIDFGEDDEGGSGFRVPGLSNLAEALNLSNDGTMWTAGFTLYF